MKTILAIVSLATVLTATNASAAITTYGTRAAFLAAAGTTTTETFNSCQDGATIFTVLSSSTPGPCGSIVAGISFTPDAGDDLYIAGPGQSANIDTALGVDFPTGGNNTVGFTVPVSAFGADLFQNFGGGFQSGADATFTFDVFGSAGLLGSFSFPVASGTGGFFGLTSTDNITSIQISQADGFAVIDNATFSAAVPEPASWALMLAGFGLVGNAMRRRSGAVAA